MRARASRWTLAQDAQDIWTQLAGEYTNHEQVVQQTFSGGALP